MVFLKANKAEGSFLGRGTHVWLEIKNEKVGKVTFSGAKSGLLLHVYRDYKRDYDRGHDRGILEVKPPDTMTSEEWDEAVIAAACIVQEEVHGNFAFNGFFPWGKTQDGILRSNCCVVARKIITKAGGVLPNGRIKGVLPGLDRGVVDYLGLAFV